MITQVQLRILGGLLVAGGLTSLVILELFLVQYQARIALPIQGQIQIYRRAEPALRSSEWFSRFAAERGKGEDDDYLRLLAQLKRGDAKPLTIEHAFALSRADFRELPEGIAREFIGQLLRKENPEGPASAQKNETTRIDSAVRLLATTADGEESQRLAKIGIDFARDVLVRLSLSDALQTWTVEAPLELVGIGNVITDHRMRIESLGRRVAQLERVRDSYKELYENAPGTVGVQVQVSDGRFLSPVQQIVGAESEKVDVTEMLRLAEQTRLRLETLTQVGAEMQVLFDAKPSSLEALQHMLSRVRSLRVGASTAKDALAIDAALGQIDHRLTTIRVRYVEESAQPPQPIVSRIGPGRLLVIAAGFLAGLGLWFALRRFAFI